MDKLDAEKRWERFGSVRAHSLAICSTLENDDYMLQAMPDVSPPKWHLAHSTWFFERFILSSCGWYKVFRPEFDYLFNSYYRTSGAFHSRAQRGLLSRPSTSAVLEYRAHVEAGMKNLLLEDAKDFRAKDYPLEVLLELGLQHEQQHQELLLTDIKFNLFSQPLTPALRPFQDFKESANPSRPLRWLPVPEGVQNIGWDSPSFSYDNERPRHKVYVEPCEVSDRLITNGEYLDFIADGGYENVAMWLSEGWDWVEEKKISHPIYWRKSNETHAAGQGWEEFTLYGWIPLDPSRAISHVSYFEADAFARWHGSRLPTEFEWEAFSNRYSKPGPSQPSFDFNALHPVVAGKEDLQLTALWQWTSSSYAPYPGFRPLSGNLAEYNGKFMVNQYVLRGGSLGTPPGHLRETYRNFFPSSAVWQFSGIRLARTRGA